MIGTILCAVVVKFMLPAPEDTGISFPGCKYTLAQLARYDTLAAALDKELEASIPMLNFLDDHMYARPCAIYLRRYYYSKQAKEYRQQAKGTNQSESLNSDICMTYYNTLVYQHERLTWGIAQRTELLHGRKWHEDKRAEVCSPEDEARYRKANEPKW